MALLRQRCVISRRLQYPVAHPIHNPPTQSPLATADPDLENAPHVVKDFFGRREMSFTINDDIYIRYQSFRDAAELAAAIQKKQPHKIDIGAVFTHPVRVRFARRSLVWFGLAWFVRTQPPLHPSDWLN